MHNSALVYCYEHDYLYSSLILFDDIQKDNRSLREKAGLCEIS